MDELMVELLLVENVWCQKQSWSFMNLLCSGMVGFCLRRNLGTTEKEHPSPTLPPPKVGEVLFLGPRGPLVLPLVDPYVRNENLDTYIQAYMPHESSGDSSNQPIGHMGSPRRLP